MNHDSNSGYLSRKVKAIIPFLFIGTFISIVIFATCLPKTSTQDGPTHYANVTSAFIIGFFILFVVEAFHGGTRANALRGEIRVSYIISLTVIYGAFLYVTPIPRGLGYLLNELQPIDDSLSFYVSAINIVLALSLAALTAITERRVDAPARGESSLM